MAQSVALLMLIAKTPRTAIIAGSGISESFAPYPIVQRIPFAQLPGLPSSDVKGHPGELLLLDVHGTHALAFLGRSHLYEGLSVQDCCSAVQWCADVGVERILFTNASGGLHPQLHIGDILLCTDVLNFTNKRAVVGNGAVRLIDQMWTSAIIHDATNNGVKCQQGTYVQVTGPSYETRAEIRMLRKMGAHVVGMSTVLEAMKAAELGLGVSIASVVTNVLSDTTPHILTHDDVLSAGRSNTQRLQTIFHSAIFAP